MCKLIPERTIEIKKKTIGKNVNLKNTHPRIRKIQVIIVKITSVLIFLLNFNYQQMLA